MFHPQKADWRLPPKPLPARLEPALAGPPASTHAQGTATKARVVGAHRRALCALAVVFGRE